MRSYGQFCATARALDLVGERWSLLIVRELLIRDCRFTDLRNGMPGIATNLLADRLRALEAAGVLERHAAPPPVATALYRLTPRGRALEPVVRELTRWGMAEMVRGAGDDATRSHWAFGAVPIMYDGADLAGVGPLVVGVETGDGELTLEVGDDGAVHVRPEPAAAVDVTLRGETEHVLAALAGHGGDLGRVEVEGDTGRLLALVARAATAPAA